MSHTAMAGQQPRSDSIRPSPAPAVTSLPCLLALALLAALMGLGGCSSNYDGGQPLLDEQAQYQARAHHYYAAPGSSSDPWGPYIREASQRFDVPEAWIRAVIHQESGGHVFDRNGNFITSAPGAMGLMQLMPPSYEELRNEYNLGDDAYDPHDNIMAGTAYIRQMYDIYGSPGFLAAYNDGPGNVDRYLRNNKPLPRETRRYVAIIGRQIAGISPVHVSDADLKVARHDGRARTGSDNDSDSSYAAYDGPTPSTSSSAAAVRAAWAAREQGGGAAPAYSSTYADNSAYNDSYNGGSSSGAYTPTPTYTPPTYGHRAFRQPLYRHAVTTRATRIGHQTVRMPATAWKPPPQKTASGNWSVQVGSYLKRAQAQQAVAGARRYGVPGQASITSVRVKGKTYWRARIGGLSGQQAARSCRQMAGHQTCLAVPPSAHF
ncbi:lytic transglycosylase domain-containing protein [Formicincola oecophyllae]|uniref:Lytic transglycosylase domain-containing protein n=2 Tax=Formicincola oecophyllae TaxID=2558361 RepID=A0A4Y6UAW3_9PROT|nr:lytic transglycosylase domain-containing protein [Formicincola oecophyllae]QDH13597.1 lytic transglycosylase domain-containing protein [Formicincola oecophyllae]